MKKLVKENCLNFVMLRSVHFVRDDHSPSRFATEVVCNDCGARMAIPYKDGDDIESGIAKHDIESMQKAMDCFSAINHKIPCVTKYAYDVLVHAIAK